MRFQKCCLMLSPPRGCGREEHSRAAMCVSKLGLRRELGHPSVFHMIRDTGEKHRMGTEGILSVTIIYQMYKYILLNEKTKLKCQHIWVQVSPGTSFLSAPFVCAKRETELVKVSSWSLLVLLCNSKTQVIISQTIYWRSVSRCASHCELLGLTY